MKPSRRPSGYKKLQCKYCTNVCDRVDLKVEKVTCSNCVQQLVDGKILKERVN